MIKLNGRLAEYWEILIPLGVFVDITFKCPSLTAPRIVSIS